MICRFADKCIKLNKDFKCTKYFTPPCYIWWNFLQQERQLQHDLENLLKGTDYPNTFGIFDSHNM